MQLLQHHGFDLEKSKIVLTRLLIDKQNVFREIGNTLNVSIDKSGMDEFILNFCLDVEDLFEKWSGKKELDPQCDIKTLTIMRQASRGKSSMVEATHLLNMSYNIATEFRLIYLKLG